MRYFFGQPTNSDHNPDNRQHTPMILLGGLAVAIFGVVLIFMLRAGAISPGWIWIAMGAGLVVVMLVAVATGIVALSRSGKRKRDLDMYSLIDRMVDDLDEDELAYLRRRLDTAKSSEHDQLTDSLDELLDQRAEARRTGQR